MNMTKTKLPFRIGMRTFKTALAVALSFLAGYAVKSDYPPFLVIGALGAMESSITESIRAAQKTFIGNTIGALLSVLFTLIFTDHVAVASTIGVILMILICNNLHFNSNITGLACVVFCCCLDEMMATGNLLYGAFRLRDMVLGTLIALAVNMLIRPYSSAERTRHGILKAQKAMLPLLEQRVLHGRIPDLRELRASINQLDKEINVLLDERMNKSLKKSQVAHLRGCQQLLWKMRDALISICCIDSMPTPSAENLARMEALGLTRESKHTESILDGVCVPEDRVVFDYYLKVFLDANDFLTELIEL